jgi:hypothetical protein
MLQHLGFVALICKVYFDVAYPNPEAPAMHSLERPNSKRHALKRYNYSQNMGNPVWWPHLHAGRCYLSHIM